MKRIIPIKIYVILFSLAFLIILIFYFCFSINQSKIEDLLINLLAGIFVVLISLSIVERMIYQSEKDKWEALDKRINAQLVDLLAFMNNIVFLHVHKMDEWIRINNKTTTPVKKLSELSQELKKFEPDEQYLVETITDDYLNQWFINNYNALLERIDALLRDFNSRLDHVQLPSLLDQKKCLWKLISELKLGNAVNKLIVSEQLVASYSSVVEIKSNIKELVSLLNDLIKNTFKE